MPAHKAQTGPLILPAARAAYLAALPLREVSHE